MTKPVPALAAFSIIFALAGCGDMFGDGAHRRPEHQEAPWHPATAILTKYITNKDGSLTRAQMEAGLRADFAAADTDHDGHLDEAEVRAVNQQRLQLDQSTASPLVDWNHDGYVDFQEFSANARSLFDELDRDGDGTLTAAELNPRGDTTKKPGDQQDPGAHHGHRGGGQGGGP
ncbi:MAG TPA: hypothetical protein VN932_13005 [Rhizomicrobium sp.]|nr:hypothetical protein [Rhizomicrobium sp.]